MQPHAKVQRHLGLQVLFDFSNITDAIAFARANGFGVLELNLGNINFTRQLASARGRALVRAAAKREGITLALHAVDGPSFFIPSERVRKCAVRELKLELDWAESIGARDVVAHLGADMDYSMDGAKRGLHEEFPEYYRAVLTDSLAELKEHARNRARLCIENVTGFRYPSTMATLARLLGGNLGLCLDVGHVNVLPPDKRRRELAFFRRYRRHIFHSHIHDNSGLRDEHLVPGQGRIDFVPFFRLLAGTDVLIVFEVRPKESAVASRDYFERVIAPRLRSRRS